MKIRSKGQAGRSERGPVQTGTEGFSPIFFGLLLLAVTLFFRFYGLTTLSGWPRFDESLCGYMGTQNSIGWDWDLRELDCHSPSLYNWGMALLFKVTGPSLFSFWLYPALLSALTVAVGFLFMDQAFDRTRAWLYAFLLAGCFWPVYFARFSMLPNGTLLLEMLVFLVLVWFWKGEKPPPLGVAVALGTLTGLGFYLYIAFLSLVPLIGLLVILRCYGGGRKWHRPFFWSVGSGLLTALPMLVDLWRDGLGNYITSISVVHNGPDANQALILKDYLASLFLFTPGTEGDYQPVGGAFLDPILGFFFLAGLWRACRQWRAGMSLVLLGGLGLGLLPALMTRTLEGFRLTAALPIVLILCAQGMEWMWKGLGGKGKFWVCSLLMASILWDGYRLLVLYPREWAAPSARWRENIKSVRSWRAFGYLDHWARMKGPGGFLDNLSVQSLDRSLTFATFPFNTASNSRLRGEDPHWVAGIVNIHYQPFLQKRFPEIQTYPLDLEGTGRYGGDMLFILPLNGKGREAVLPWFDLNRGLDHNTLVLVNRWRSGPRDAILNELLSLEPLTRNDPFLESCLLEKIYVQLCYEIAYQEVPRDQVAPLCVRVLDRALQKGYPLAHLWNELGNHLLWMGRKAEAKRAFENAVKAPLNKTQAAARLREL